MLDYEYIRVYKSYIQTHNDVLYVNLHVQYKTAQKSGIYVVQGSYRSARANNAHDMVTS